MNLEAKLQQLAQLCEIKGVKLATAESCTGGLVSAAITDLAGSSNWFDCGFVTYSNEAKMALLDVKGQTLHDHGAVSEATALQMAEGAVRNSQAHLAVSISGIAGPGGGSVDKPVGTVCFAISDGGQGKASTCYFAGDRAAVREQALQYAVEQFLSYLQEP